RAQEQAGIDICTDGDAHFDDEVAGMSWQSYAPRHMSGFAPMGEMTAYKVAQRLTRRPVKFGTILPELIAASVEDEHYKNPVERSWALSDALREELHETADAGCPVLQLEEPQIHMVPARGKAFGKLDTRDLAALFNNTVKGLCAKTEVWCHTCWGNPAQQRIFKEVQSYQPTLDALATLD